MVTYTCAAAPQDGKVRPTPRCEGEHNAPRPGAAANRHKVEALLLVGLHSTHRSSNLPMQASLQCMPPLQRIQLHLRLAQTTKPKTCWSSGGAKHTKDRLCSRDISRQAEISRYCRSKAALSTATPQKPAGTAAQRLLSAMARRRGCMKRPRAHAWPRNRHMHREETEGAGTNKQEQQQRLTSLRAWAMLTQASRWSGCRSMTFW